MKRTVVSMSVSEQNPDAEIVRAALEARGIPLTRGGGRILAWAAAFLTAPLLVAVQTTVPDGQDFGLSEDEIDALLDDF